MQSVAIRLSICLKALPQSKLFSIEDKWDGLGMPRQVLYTFIRQPDAFRGQAKFEIGYSPKSTGEVRGGMCQ